MPRTQAQKATSFGSLYGVDYARVAPTRPDHVQPTWVQAELTRQAPFQLRMARVEYSGAWLPWWACFVLGGQRPYRAPGDIWAWAWEGHFSDYRWLSPQGVIRELTCLRKGIGTAFDAAVLLADDAGRKDIAQQARAALHARARAIPQAWKRRSGAERC